MNPTFHGIVSAQNQAGETVTLTVTKPDGTTDVFTAMTLADKSYSVTRTYTVAGNYSVTAHVDADAQFNAANSTPYPFTVALQDRTVTVNVTL